MTGHLPVSSGRYTSARSTRPSSARMGTSQSMCIPSRVSLVKSVIASGSQDEVERRRPGVGAVPNAQDELAPEDGIARVTGFAGEIELGREHRSLRRLYLDVNMAGPPGVAAGYDRLEAIAALVVGVLMAAQAIAGVVVRAAVVGVPDVDQRARNRLAAREPDHAGDDDLDAAHARLDERRPLGRVRLEVGALGLTGRGLRAIRAARGWPERLGAGGARRPGHAQRCGCHPGEKCAKAATLHRPLRGFDSGNYPSDWRAPLSTTAPRENLLASARRAALRSRRARRLRDEHLQGPGGEGRRRGDPSDTPDRRGTRVPRRA